MNKQNANKPQKDVWIYNYETASLDQYIFAKFRAHKTENMNIANMLKQYCRDKRHASIVMVLLTIAVMLLFNRERLTSVNFSHVNSTDVGRFNLALYENKQCYDTVIKLLDRNFEEDIWCELIRACTSIKNNVRGECNMTKEVFRQIFSPTNFRSVSCPERRAGPPTVYRGMVALASFPGSGNTWTRHLAERLTGR